MSPVPRAERPQAEREKIALLSEKLHETLLEDQRKAKARKGMAKCPACGAIVAPTKNKRIRKHESDPYEHEVCEASGKSWKEYGKRAPASPRDE